jgi:D-aminopeptidase
MDYIQSFDSSFDGLFQIGAHAMSRTQEAVFERTLSSEYWVEMLINGRPFGKIGLCAALAGHFEASFVNGQR